MLKKFTLSDITFLEYNQLCDQARIPREHLPPSFKKRKKYFILQDHFEYKGLQNILDEVNTELTLSFIWIPHGNMFISEASRSTRYKLHDYLEHLQRIKFYAHGILLQTENLKRRIDNEPHHLYQDIFRFYHTNGVWMLKQIIIKRADFPLYEFETLSGDMINLDAEQSISAIYPTNPNKL